MEISHYIEIIAQVIEIIGIATIAIGILWAMGKYFFSIQKSGVRSYKLLRQEMGKGILLGLEILVAADIVATVVTEPTMNRVLTLGMIVLIRTFLSFSLQVELEGRFPWQGNQGKDFHEG